MSEKLDEKKKFINALLTQVQSGTPQESGFYKCLNCGQNIYLETKKLLPKCPKCTLTRFEKL